MAEEKEKETTNLFGIDLSTFEEAEELIKEREKANPNEEIDEEVDEEKEKVDEEINEEEDEETGKQKQKEDPSSQKIKESSPLAPYAKLLVEEGVFQSSDIKDWDGTTEGFVKLEMKKLEEWKEDYKSSLHPRLKWLQENLDEGVSLKQLLEADEQNVALTSITPERLEEDGDLQKNIARLYYKKTTSFSDEKIEKLVTKSEESDELREESKEFFEELKKIDEKERAKILDDAKKAKEDAIKEQQKVLNTFKSTLDKTEEVVPGLKINSIMRDKIYKTMTTVVEVDKDSGTPLNKISKARMADPINFEIKLAYIFELTNGFTDWSAFSTSGKKKAYSEFEAAAKELDKGKSQTQRRVNTNPDIEDFYKHFGNKE